MGAFILQMMSGDVNRNMQEHEQLERSVLTAYVRHYLTDDGIQYFQKEWFPHLNAVVSQQPGFISLSFTINGEESDRMDVVLKFQDEATLNAWAELPIHDEFVTALDVYRSRDYWEVVLTEDESVDATTLEWMHIKV